jgi:hypothetical protein
MCGTNNFGSYWAEQGLNFFGSQWYDLPGNNGFGSNGAQEESRYVSIMNTGWDPELGINWNDVDYHAQANGQYKRLSGNLGRDFGPGVTADPTNCDLEGGHCNFPLICDPSQTACPSSGRYDNGIHIEVKDGVLVVHDDTVSPWTGSFSAWALFTGNFWEHGFVDLFGGTFFVGAFPK